MSLEKGLPGVWKKGCQGSYEAGELGHDHRITQKARYAKSTRAFRRHLRTSLGHLSRALPAINLYRSLMTDH